MCSMRAAVVLCCCAISLSAAAPPTFILSETARARVFGGIGGISGGGATSRTLFDYAEPARSAIMDLLYSPGVGAGFQNVKVEVPADADTTCGSEVAHRHDADDGGSCTRGYEGFILASAAERRPGITTSALQWAAPRFVSEADVDGGKSLLTSTNVREYVIPWLACIQSAYNITIDWMGANQNEHPHNSSYIKLMRQELDAAGLQGTGLTAADQCCGSNWKIVDDMVADPALAAAIGMVTTHVAGSLEENTPTPAAALSLGVPLSQGEEHLGLPDPDPVPVWELAAAAATGVEISQNWVVNSMSSTVFWPMAYGWLSGLLYRGKGFVVATTPFAPAPAPYYVPDALFIVAHTTHFTTPGVSWLLNASDGHIGAGRVITFPGAPGGWNTSWVAYVPAACSAATPAACDLTLVVESFLAGGVWHSGHGRAAAGADAPAVATFALADGLRQRLAGGVLHVWHSNSSVTFEREADAAVGADGTFAVSVEPGAIYTFTSIASAHPGARALLATLAPSGAVRLPYGVAPPDDAPFPLPFADDFESYANDSLPLFSSDMFGAFTVYRAANASGAPPPLRTAHPDAAVRAAVACHGAAAAAARPQRCVAAAPRAAASGVLRQWTRAPPLGWNSGDGVANMATLYGNSTLRNVRVALAALIEAPAAGYPPPATPYVLIGLHGGAGTAGGSAPGDFYRQGPDADFFWLDVEGRWGCSIAGSPPICSSSHALPSGFGYDVWHDVAISEVPRADGGATMQLSFDGQLLANVSQAPGTLKNGGRGGYVLLATGCHRSQFDNLLITENAAA